MRFLKIVKNTIVVKSRLKDHRTDLLYPKRLYINPRFTCFFKNSHLIPKYEIFLYSFQLYQELNVQLPVETLENSRNHATERRTEESSPKGAGKYER